MSGSAVRDRVHDGRTAIGLVAAALTLAAAAPVAFGAIESGVHIDPGSPVAKEYGVPLDVARSDASPLPAAGSAGGSPRPPALFGAGIVPAPRSAGAASGLRGVGRGSGRSSLQPAGRGAPSPRASGDGMGSPIVWMLGSVVAVLAAGAAGAAALRRFGGKRHQAAA